MHTLLFSYECDLSLHAYLYKVPPTLLSYLDERIAGHVLYTIVSLVHELKQFVHHCLQELPVCPVDKMCINNSGISSLLGLL